MSHSIEAPVSGEAAAGDKLDKKTMAIAWVVVVGTIMAILDATIVNVAINKLAVEFDSSLSTIQWVVTGYMLALATVIPLTGWSIHRFGSKRLYMLSIFLFMIGSGLAGAAWSDTSLIAFRILQGFGGGMIMPAGMTILTQAAGPARIGRVMAIVGMPMMIGPISGPILGGWLVDDVSWRAIFFVNVPIGILALALAQRVLPKDKPQVGHPLDFLGLALLSPGLASLVYGLAQMAAEGGFNGPKTIVPTIVGAVLIVLFCLHALRAKDPLLDLRLFARRSVAAASITMTLFTLAFFGSMLMLPLYFQLVRHESALMSGLLLAPQGIGALVTMPLGGILTDRYGPGKLVLGGIATIVATMFAFTQIATDTSYVYLSAVLFFMGLGMGFTMMPTMTAALQTLKQDEVPRASTSLNIIQQVGGAIGTAILSVLLANTLVDHFQANPVTKQIAAKAPSGLAAVYAIPPQIFDKVSPLIAESFGTVFWWALAFCVASFVPAVFLPMRKPAMPALELEEEVLLAGADEDDRDDDGVTPPPVLMH